MDFNTTQFRNKINQALEQVKLVLENNRRPQLPENVNHTYQDKYLLAEFVCNTSLAAVINSFANIGISGDVLKKLVAWCNENKSVSLRFIADEKCTFVKEQTRKVESPSYTSSTFMGIKKTEKIVTTIVEYFWDFEASYKLFAFQGNDLDEKSCVNLLSGSGKVQLITTTDTTPKPKQSSITPIDLNISYLLQQINKDKLSEVTFKINRDADSCKTPRRNEDVYKVLDFNNSLTSFASAINNYFRNRLFPVQENHGLALGEININRITNPIIPFFEKGTKAGVTPTAGMNFQFYEAATNSKVILPISDLNSFLKEQQRTIETTMSLMGKTFPSSTKLITAQAARICVICLHLNDLSFRCQDGIDYIEKMLYDQLISAIGKIVTATEFSDYMRFHYRKLYKEEYAPLQLCYCIRRPDHYPEGILTVEASQNNGKLPVPMLTFTKKTIATAPMKFPINASTNISFYGERYVHGFIENKFSNNTGTSLSLSARARQFSSFMLLVGRIGGADLFQPTSAIILKNKDDLTIPLLLEQIPTPKAFRDAIESLSPEQQRFAKAFRSMQLEGTLFGICIIQIKPQLEKVLNVPSGSLTKQIKLTQDLMELFIDYQIPCDLLAFDGSENQSKQSKLDQVQSRVTEMQEMINEEKQKELEEKRKAEEYRLMLELEKQRAAEERQKERQMMRERELKKESSRRQSRSRNAAPNFHSMAKKSMAPRNMMCAAPMRSAAAPMPMRSAAAAMPTSHMAPLKKMSKSVKPIPKPAKSAAKPKPTPVETPTPKAKEPDTPKTKTKDAMEIDSPIEVEDYTKIPVALDAKYEELDVDNAVQPTIINPGTTWQLRAQKALLAAISNHTLQKDEQTTEKNRAFDLLDALSKSGLLSFDEASLHVIVAATHCFDKNLMDTVIQDNINPIEKVERTSLIVATTIHNKNAEELIKPNQLKRVKTYSSVLFKDDNNNEKQETN